MNKKKNKEAKLKFDMNRYKQTVHETEEAKKQLSRTLLEVMEQKQNLELLRAQYQRAKEDSGKYLDICELSRVDLQKTKDEHDKVKRMIQEMVPALNASKADSAVVQQKLADLKKEMDELEREKTNIVHHNHMLKMENEKQERETARQRTEMVECLHKLDDLQTNLRSKKSALEKLDAQAQAQFLHQHQVLENGEISRLFEGEVARLQKQLEAVKTQNQLDLQNLQKVFIFLLPFSSLYLTSPRSSPLLFPFPLSVLTLESGARSKGSTTQIKNWTSQKEVRHPAA